MIQVGFLVFNKNYKLNREETIRNLKKIQIRSSYNLLNDGTQNIGRVKELEDALEISLSLLQQFWQKNKEEETEEFADYSAKANHTKTVNRLDFWQAVSEANRCETSSEEIFSSKAYLLIAERIDEILFDLPKNKKIEPE